MPAADYVDEVRRLSGLLDAALSFLREQVREAAEAEQAYRKAKGRAWVEVPEGTVPEREAWVDEDTADVRFARDVAAGMKKAAIEAVRARRAQISAIQSVLAMERAEAEFVRTTPTTKERA